MSRERWFCSLCGAMTERRPERGQTFARCVAHAGLPQEAELIPPDPATVLPTQAEEVAEEWRVIDQWWTDAPDVWEYREVRSPEGQVRTEQRRPDGEWRDSVEVARARRKAGG